MTLTGHERPVTAIYFRANPVSKKYAHTA